MATLMGRRRKDSSSGQQYSTVVIVVQFSWQLAFHRGKMQFGHSTSSGTEPLCPCAFQDQIASRETHLKFHRKSAERRWLLMRVGAQKQFCLHPIKSKLQLVANCIFNCNNYHPLVLANEVTEWLAEWRHGRTMQLQLPRTFRESSRVGGREVGGYIIISNHPLSRNRSRGWGSALNCNVMARLDEMELREGGQAVKDAFLQ